jgi:membrane protease YdiL (CAAX protease family)
LEGCYRAVVAILVAVNLLNNLLVPRAYVLTCVAATGLLLSVGRRDGLSWSEIGLDRASLRSGLRWSAALLAVVLLGVAVAAALPATRPAFVDARAAGLSGTAVLVRTLVRIPLGTALLEEVAFRGVLYAMLARRHGVRAAVLGSSLLFGLWHVLPSLGLRDGNAAVGSLFGAGPEAAVAAVAAAVAGTAAAGLVFCEVRRRSGGLLAPFALHWAINSVTLAAAWVLGGR